VEFGHTSKKRCWKRKDHLQRWKEDIQKGVRVDKFRAINSETFGCFTEARRSLEQVKI